MPTLTISLDAGAQSRSMSKTVSAAHLIRFLDALKQRFPGEDGAELTNAEVFDLWAQRLVFGEARHLTLKEEERIAQRAASASVPDFVLS